MSKSISSLSSLVKGRGLNFINGARIAGSGASENIYSPADGKVSLAFHWKLQFGSWALIFILLGYWDI